MMRLTLRFGLVEGVLIAIGVSALETAHGHPWGIRVYLPAAIIGEVYMWVFVVRLARLMWQGRRVPLA